MIRHLSDSRRPPTVVFSAGGLLRDRIEALDAGAVDYIAKPFLNDELLSRLRSVLHRSKRVEIESTSRYTFGDLDIDLQNRRVFLGETQLNLTSHEFRLLNTFVRNDGRLLTYRFLMDEVFEPNENPDQSKLVTIVAQLRHKIESNPLRPRHLCVESGVGYRFRVDG